MSICRRPGIRRDVGMAGLESIRTVDFTALTTGLSSLERLDAATRGPAIAALIAEFDRCWDARVTRTREVMVVADLKRSWTYDCLL